jgi:hypothetical protein
VQIKSYEEFSFSSKVENPAHGSGWIGFNHYLHTEQWLLQIPPTVVGGWFNSNLVLRAVNETSTN